MRKQKALWCVLAVTVMIGILTLFFIQQRASEEEIKIGAVLSLSGPASFVGEETRDGMLLAIHEINPRGGINGKKLELIIEDSKANAEEGKEAFNRIEEAHHPSFYISTLSSVGMALAPLAERNKTVLIALVATAPELTEQNEWVFRYFPTAKDEVPPILSILEELKVRELGMIYVNGAYGRSFFELTRQGMERIGGVVQGEIHEGKDSVIKDQITRLKDTKGLYVVVDPAHYEKIFKELKEQRYGGIVVAAGNVSSPPVKSLPEAEGVYLVAPIIYNPDFLYAQEVRKSYENTYGKPFNHYAAAGYDIIKLLTGLLEDEAISREKIKSLLEEGFVYPGIFGDLDVRPGEHDIYFPLHPAQIVDGKIMYLR